MAQTTKRTIQITFLQLLEKQSMDKVTVRDIVEECGINRNTFYYYYKDIYDLLEDVFKEELKRLESIENNVTDWKITLEYTTKIVLEHKKAIENVYLSKFSDVVENYLFTAAAKSIRKYIWQKKEEYHISDKNMQFLCDYCSYTIVGMMVHWIRGNMQYDADEFLNKMSSIMEVSIEASLKQLENNS